LTEVRSEDGEKKELW